MDRFVNQEVHLKSTIEDCQFWLENYSKSHKQTEVMMTATKCDIETQMLKITDLVDNLVT